jgi:deoxyribodipyrimidine photolyase-like uncharacterized protein
MVVFPEEGKINSEEAVLIIERSQGGSSPRHHQKKKSALKAAMRQPGDYMSARQKDVCAYLGGNKTVIIKIPMGYPKTCVNQDVQLVV